MAKIRRIIRKVDRPKVGSLEDQLWPVHVALIILGGFLVGTVLAYARFDDPRPWANSVTWLIMIPIAIVGAMIALRFFGERMVRRSMQLALIVSVMIHIALLIVLLNVMIFSRMFPEILDVADLVKPKRVATLPDYHPSQLDDKQKQRDFEKPVETQPPEPERELVQRQETEQEPTPSEPQPTPVPETEPTPKPNIVRREQTSETSPRQSEQQSKLSRQMSRAMERPNQQATPVETPQTAQTQPANPLQSQSSEVSRQQTRVETQQRTVEQEPTTVQPNQVAQLHRRTTEQRPTPTDSTTPTMRREIAQPTEVPRTQVQVDTAAAVAQQTTPTAVTPNNVTADKQATASPQVDRQATEPTPDTPTQVTAQVQRQQQPTEPRPTLAQTPTSVPNERTRLTNRPNVTTVASAAPAAAAPAEATPTPSVQPQASQVQRTTTDVPVERATPTVEPSPTPTQQPTSQVARRSDTSMPTSQPTSAATATPTLSRNTPTRSPAPSTQVAATAPTAVTTQSQATAINASSVATRKQDTAAPQTARSQAEPTAAVSPSAPSTTPSPALARSDRATPSPTVASEAATAVARSTAARSTPETTTAVESVATQTSAPATSTNPQPRPTSSEMARQPSSSPAASMNQPSLEVAAASPSTQAARAPSPPRATTASVPSLNPEAAPSSTPARAAQSAPVAASPTNVESPALAQAAQGAGEPTAQPARMALAKAVSGTAGVGQSMNLDRALPAADSPAMVASAAANRATATQDSPDNPAFTPSSQAVVSRSRAGAEAPASTLKAQPVAVATAGGVDSPSELTASSSASLTQASANAASGPVAAAQGTTDVDLGATRLVSEGASGRASGGGQPEINPNTQSPQLARSTPGGAPQVSLTTDQVADAAQAPSAAGGGQPLASMIDPTSVSAVRTDAGGGQPISGGPASSDATGPPTETSTAEMLARTQMKRAEAGGEAAPSAGGSPSDSEDEDEEEKARRLARSATGGAPQLALAAPTLGDSPLTPAADSGDAGGPAGALEARAAASQLARTDAGGGSPVAAEATPNMELAAGGAASGGETRPAAQAQRAEAVEAVAGAATPGGGSSSPARAATGPQFTANTQAVAVQIAGAPTSSGAPDAMPLQAQGVEASRAAGGSLAPATASPVGAAAGEMVVETLAAAQPGGVVGSRSAAPVSDEDGPSLGDAIALAMPAKRGSANIAPAGASAAVAVNVPSASGDASDAKPDMGDLAGGVDVGPMSRQATGGLAVNMDAPDGPGGLGQDYSVDVGLNTRRASSESIQVALRSARFVQKQVGGVPDVNTAAIVATEPFRRRATRDPSDGSDGGAGRPGPATEEAIELGLVFLARYQSPDGSWTLQRFNEDVALASDTAATALALLAFQGAGYNHREFKYADVVRRGVEFMVKNQKEDGDLFVPLDDQSNQSVWLYSHAIAALALCEAYGMTQDPELREPAQKALDFIIKGQHETRGGWRYSPNYGSDTSVTGWMMMALKSGELANLDVPAETYRKIDAWLDLSQASKTQPHLFRYNPYAPDTPTQRHGRQASTTMTSVGLLMRLYLDWHRDDPNMRQGAEYLMKHLPTLGTSREPKRDTYYWYYGTQVMFHMGGKYWETWNQALHPLLVDTQIQSGPMAGSWDPRGSIPDQWAPHAGRLYVTTMNLLSLEVHYRHLPLYEDTAK